MSMMAQREIGELVAHGDFVLLCYCTAFDLHQAAYLLAVHLSELKVKHRAFELKMRHSAQQGRCEEEGWGGGVRVKVVVR